MNKSAKVIKLSILIIVTTLTLVTVTFAWIISINKTDPIIVQTGSLRVGAELYYLDGTDEIIVGDGGINLKNVVPGKVYDFKLVITNLGSIPGHLGVHINNIEYSDEIMKNTFKIIFDNPLTNELESKYIEEEEMSIFEEYVLNEETIYTFYFSIEGTKDISSKMRNESLILSSFLIRLDQIQG